MGETVGPPQEDTGTNTRTRANDRTSLVRWLTKRKLALFATAALSATAMTFQHERLAAAEIQPASTWIEGIQKLHNGVLSDAAETLGIFYIDNQTHREKWIAGKEGKREGVEITHSEVEKAVESELAVAPTQSITLCGLHTHPISIIQASEYSAAHLPKETLRDIHDEKQYISLPPSMDDIDLASEHTWEKPVWNVRAKGITADIRLGVLDAAGISYHRPIQEQELEQQFPQYFAELQQRKAISDEWKETVNPVMDKLDAAIVNKLHDLILIHTKDMSKYIKGSYSEKEVIESKRQDLKDVLIDGSGIRELGRHFSRPTQKVKKYYRTLRPW
jgi:hypothetical protein